MKSNQVLLNVILSNQGDWDRIQEHLSKKLEIELTENEVYEFEKDHKYITILDEVYKTSLKHIHKPPFALFYEGNLSLLNNNLKTIAIACSMCSKRQKSEYHTLGMKLNQEPLNIVLDLECEITPYIINNHSPLHNIIVVAPYSIDNVDSALKDKIIKNGGLLISEYPSTNTNKSQEQRYKSARIVIGLCNSLLLLSTLQEQNDTIQTMVYVCLHSGKETMVVPTEITEIPSLNNKLIGLGATIIYDSETLLKFITE